MATHTEAHPQAGETVQVNTVLHSGAHQGEAYLEDWWDHLTGTSWGMSDGNPAVLDYAARAAMQGLPLDDEIVYVKISGLGHLLHASEVVS